MLLQVYAMEYCRYNCQILIVYTFFLIYSPKCIFFQCTNVTWIRFYCCTGNITHNICQIK